MTSANDPTLRELDQLWNADLPVPPDALPGSLSDWTRFDDRDGRTFTAYLRTIELDAGDRLTVEVEAVQYSDGEIERTVKIEAHSAAIMPLPGFTIGDLTADQARELSDALREAARRAAP